MRALASILLLIGGVAAGHATTIVVALHEPDATPLADAVVVLEPLDAMPPPGHAAASIDQVQQRFVPKISVIRTGTEVLFPNSDRIRHQVYSFSKPNVFTLKLYAGRAAPPVLFDRPGLVILGCNIHDTMVAFVVVTDSPYFGQTNAAGRVTLEAPAGHYRLRIWHPELDPPVEPTNLTLEQASALISLDVRRATDAAIVARWLD
jgi:plastocyanin